ncbi:MAG: phosphatase PAP2 family protein [Bacteroidota bacterium]|nr:phosphatase PAP2 family protein [Bacteroidota bacterium]
MKQILLFTFLLCATFAFSQQNPQSYDSKIPQHYFDYSLKLVKETAGFSPPVAARAFGYMGLTSYEAIVQGMDGYLSTKDRLFGFDHISAIDPQQDYNWPTVVNNALAMIVDSLFRTTTQIDKDSLHTIRDNYNASLAATLPANVYEASKSFGEQIAIDVLDYSRTDGAHNGFASNFPPNYIPPIGEALWIPFGNQACLQPFWGNNRPFIEADSAVTTISPPHLEFSTTPGSGFFSAVDEVYATGLTLTPEETNIALYWADGGGSITPGGHSISMLNAILRGESANLEVAALAYAKLGIALSDAFLACWKTKYIYNLCRPVTYIQNHIDTSWLPLIGTPPFPEYPSGHSSQSGAMATIMSDIFGGQYEFTDSTHLLDFGGPRNFSSFTEAAEEAAVSRLLGGIHYTFSNDAGLTLGTIVGQNVNALFEGLNVANEEIVNASSAFVSPNPASDNIIIHTEADSHVTEYQITDLLGNMVMKGSFTNNINEVAITSLLPGVYIVKLDTQEKGIRFVKT